jgi:hypothetical protein
LNVYEVACLIVAELTLFLYLRWQFKSWSMALLLAALAAVPLYVSLERGSQFLTTDERGIVSEAFALETSGLRQWVLGANHTTELLLGIPLFFLRRALPGVADVEWFIILKNLHWMTGFATLLWAHWIVNKYFVSERGRALFCIIFMYGTFLLPTDILSLKIFNYDLLSMTLSVLALLYLLVALRQRDTRHASVGVVVAFLAASEKSSASPFLMLALGVYTYLSASENGRFRPARAAWRLLLAFATVLSLAAAGALLLAAMRHGSLPVEIWLRLPYPLVAWILVPFAFVVGGDPFSVSQFALLGLAYVAALLLALGAWCAQQLSARLAKPSRARLLPRVSLLLVILVLLVGVLGTNRVQVVWWPYVPVSAGHYLPPGVMNKVVYHFNAPSFWVNLGMSVAYAYVVLVNAMPTVYWLCLLGATVVATLCHREVEPSLEVELMLTLGLLAPLVFGVAQIPVGNKYLNIPLLLVALSVLVKVARSLQGSGVRAQTAVGAALCALLVLEVLPFRPLCAPFRPIWSEYPHSETPLPGVLNPSWMGWGEEALLGAELLEERCRASGNNSLDSVPCESITLCVAYSGVRLSSAKLVKDRIRAPELDPTQVMQSRDKYWIVNRNAIAQGRCFPVAVKPAFTLGFRGFTQAWIYRFDQLAAAGYAFNRGLLQCPTP